MTLSRLVNNLFSLVGVRLVRERELAPVLNTEVEVLDAVELQYFLRSRGLVIATSVIKGRALPLFSYGRSTNHPFVLAARAASKEKDGSRVFVINNILSAYYKRVCPTNINGMFGLSSPQSELNEFPNWAAVMPWDEEDVFQWQKKIEKSVSSENAQYTNGLGVEDGWAWVGPTGDLKCEIESRRLLGVLESILKYGYTRHSGPDGDIVANILVKSPDEWIWQSIGAQHRASVLTALGQDVIPVRVMRIIRRDDVLSWPNVKRGLFAKEEALKVFDDIFEARYSHVTSKWDEYVSENGYFL
jgi:hypothetical protein